MRLQKLNIIENKGITLIALVITIIILLILAGVSIGILAGDNGIITQAESANIKYLEAETIEKIQIEVLSSFGNNGKIDKEQLNHNLMNVSGLVYKDEVLSDSNKISNLPIIVRVNGHDIEINSDGEVRKVPDIIAQIINNPKAYYGKEVINYKNDGKTYRLFYVDKENYFGDGENTIYLKSDYSGSVICSTLYDAKQTKIKDMNPLWAKERYALESNWNENEKATAWLCDPSKWTEYCDTEKAQYAVGGPSVEMYVKSYNQAYSGMTNVNVLGTNYRETVSPGYIYTLNGTQSTISKNDYSTGDNSLDYKKYNNMYCGKNEGKTGDWWLASPCSLSVARMCFVYGYGAKIDYRNYNSSNRSGISALICLKSSFTPEFKE